jgi:glycosyltransferase involved in cell wall biosynthesis
LVRWYSCKRLISCVSLVCRLGKAKFGFVVLGLGYMSINVLDPMVTDDSSSPAAPLFSVIIGSYNDWVPLDNCLASLAQQTDGPSFEVIVVDDGSREEAPLSVRRWEGSYPLTLLRQAHSGVAAARNRGIQISKGSVLVFADSDCKFQADSLANLASIIADSPQHSCFQLRLVGDASTFVGKTEELRLSTLQKHLLQPNGCIRYLNTAGFAIRRARANTEGFAFEPAAIRAEDTLVLANLMQGGELPFFAANSVIQHATSLSLMDYFLKAIWSAYQEGRTYDIIASMGVRVRANHRERLGMFSSMWKRSEQQSIGRSACLMLAARQFLRLMTSFLYRFLHGTVQLSHLDNLFLEDASSRRLSALALPNRARIEISDRLTPGYQTKAR